MSREQLLRILAIIDEAAHSHIRLLMLRWHTSSGCLPQQKNTLQP